MSRLKLWLETIKVRPVELVIEVLSPSTRRRDEGLKLERYELLGVQEYWVVDPARSAAHILTY